MAKLLIIGHSHVAALMRAHNELAARQQLPDEIQFILLRSQEFLARPNLPLSESRQVSGINSAAVRSAIGETGASKTILCLNGNAHTAFALEKTGSTPIEDKFQRLFEDTRVRLSEWLNFLLPELPGDVAFLMPPPPPIAPGEEIRPRRNHLISEIASDEVRLALSRKECQAIRTVCKEFNIPVIELPDSIYGAGGFLAEDCSGKDLTHGNTEYGKRVLLSLNAGFERKTKGAGMSANMDDREESSHPYAALPDTAFWKQAISTVPSGEVDPVTAPPFRIQPKDKVATAGSCFAQHISKRLRAGGFHFMVTEQAAGDEADNQARGFYDFSARYGNIYTARQLLQLFDRAFGYFRPLERVWSRPGGGYCDPFRPRIEPDGFPSEEAVLKDAQKHLQAVRRMFRQLDVFVFTLGLTECWLSRLDGAAYPVAPGVAGGKYDPEKHVFVNFTVAEVTADLRIFLAKLRLVNPKARLLLTVSPVPLVATAADRHVLVSTVYSKSVLRVAAEEIVNSHANVCYFPSYEIITGPHAGGGYFAADRRSVTEAGVDHVMRIFMGRMTGEGRTGTGPAVASQAAVEDAAMAEAEALAEALCDEEMLER